jgi:hypothetical protein
MDRQHQKTEAELCKEEADKHREGGVPFNGRGCMSFEIQKSWLSEDRRMYRSHGPLLTAMNI